MTVAAGAAPATAAPRGGALDLYRDDGPPATLLGARLGQLLRLPPLVLVVAGAIPLVAALGAVGDGSRAAVAGCVALLVVLAGASGGRPHDGRFDWAVPPLLRAVEYGTLTWLAALADPRTVTACFCLLGVLAFRHYDAVYRLRFQAVAPPRWVRVLGGGWDGRLLLAAALFLAGALLEGLVAAAAVLAVASVAESVAGWLRFSRAERPALYADDEDEDA